MRKINVFQILGSLLLVVSAALVFAFFAKRMYGAKQTAQIVRQIESNIPTREAGMKKDESEDQMPVYEIGGEEFICLLEIPIFDLTLPVSAEWEKKQLNDYPCRFWGSAYSDTLMVGGADTEGQFDVLSMLDLGDEIFVTDLTGAEYAYKVERIDRSKTAEAEKLYNPDYDLTLFVRDTYGLDYIIVRCKDKWN